MSPPTQDQIKKLVNVLIVEAVKARASDIHFDATEDGGGRVRFRVDGVLRDQQPLPETAYEGVIERVKVMADLDTSEHRLTQVGRCFVTINGEGYDFRVSVVPAFHGERVVIRILTGQGKPPELERLGLTDAQLETMRQLSSLPHGLLIVTGPAGSGKTTMLYGMIGQVDSSKSCVITIEDPVGEKLDGVAQIETRPQIGLTTVRVFREVMRQDPDVIMVHEIRDLEILEAVLLGAATGHLVLTTLHAPTAPAAVRRLLDLGIEPYRINANLRAVISTRLVRILCEQCKRPVEPPLHSAPPQVAEILKQDKEASFFEPAGCEACGRSGFRGRTGIFEILVMNDAVRQAVAGGGELNDIAVAAVASGMEPLLTAGLKMAARGITSLQEVLRVAPPGFASA